MFHLARQWEWWKEPVVVVGTGERAARTIRSIQQAGDFGYRPVAVLAIGASIDTDIEGVPVVGDLDQAATLAAQGIRVALLETRRADPFRERSTVDRLQQDFRHVVLIREYDDLPVAGLQIRTLGNLVGIEYTNNLLLHGNRLLKRALDVVLAGLGLIVAAPVIVCAAALVRLLDGGPAFFVQDRAGLDGRRIAVPKIRTMRREAERRLEEYLAANPDLREEWEAHYKLKSDPRLIPIIGRLFRRFSIDELPQLWTVLQGDMSVVGPRPFPDYHMQHFSPAFLELRRRVRPGITGLWQVTVRSAGSTAGAGELRQLLHPKLVGMARPLHLEQDDCGRGQWPRRVLRWGCRPGLIRPGARLRFRSILVEGDLAAPDHFGPAPVLVENRPQHLIPILAVAKERAPQHTLLDRADFSERRVPARVLEARASFQPMNADDVEREVHHEFRSCPEHARAPERRSDGETPFGRSEARFELPQLKEANGGVEAVDDDGEGGLHPYRSLSVGPVDESLEAVHGMRWRRHVLRHFIAADEGP